MPKKFKGENSKSAVARARKQEQREIENTRKEKEKEDEYWRDDDKHVAKKQQRKVCNCVIRRIKKVHINILTFKNN